MGHGDDLIATGLARGFARRGKRAAFGDGRQIVWGPWSAGIFRNNPNIAVPGSERGADDLIWIAHYKGNRLYNRPGGRGWIWNYSFRPVPGEIFLDPDDLEPARTVAPGYVLIEPNAPEKRLAPNKQWPHDRWAEVSRALSSRGCRIVQLEHDGTRQRLAEANLVPTSTFRQALGVLGGAGLFIGHEGGMHHGAAAMSRPAVVIFGGFIPPEVTGYSGHVNLSAGAPACGSTTPCSHCRAALEAITVERVVDSALSMVAWAR